MMDICNEKDRNANNKKDTPSWLLSCRTSLAMISFLGLTNLYALRVNMSVAMVCMINQTALSKEIDDNIMSIYGNSSHHENRECDVTYNRNLTSAQTNEKDGDFTWSKSTQGMILGSFFWGYMTTQFVGGWVSGRFGGKRVFGWCMLVCALFTLAIPLAADTGPVFLIICRIIIGCCQGVVWPTMHAMWAYWSPPLERSKLIGFSFSGAHFGTVLTFPFAGFLCDYGFAGGWPSIFYTLGSFGILWFIAWMYIAHDSPRQHPRITEEEKSYIQESLAGQMTVKVDKKSKIPWLAILTSKAVWAICLAHVSSAWIIYTFLTNIPTYMREVLKFDISQNGLISSIPFIGMWIMTIVSGLVADTARQRRIMNTTHVRKLSNALGMIIPSIICIILGYLDCTQRPLAITLLVIAVSLLGLIYGSGLAVNHADIAPQYASLIFGITNTMACIPGFLAPYIIGIVTSNQSQEEWRFVFFITAAITSFGAILYLFIGSGEQQEWAAIPVRNKEDTRQLEKKINSAASGPNDNDVGKMTEM